MKINGNDKQVSDYYIGLDVGTNSVGWAVTDESYSLLKCRGNAMWGVRLFEEATDASARRQSRTARRRGQRRHQRLEWLELLFNEEIGKVDPLFFDRLKSSSLYLEDRRENIGRYALFNDKNYTDKDYLKAYPTAYHLRRELISSKAPHDVRLVFLALHHLIKSRGHFLFDMDTDEGEYKGLEDIFDAFCLFLQEEYGIEPQISDRTGFLSVLKDGKLNVTAKKKALKALIAFGESPEDSPVGTGALVDALAGATVKFSDLFNDEALKDAEKKSVCLKNDLDADFDVLSETLGDRIRLILQLKSVFDSGRLSQMLGDHEYICQAKVEQFETNKTDLLQLKKYVRENAPEKKALIFSKKDGKLNNFAAYCRRTVESGEHTCSQEDLCKFLRAELPGLKDDPAYADLARKIEDNSFYPKLKDGDNALIPHQLHERELKKILESASAYLDFLNKEDADGTTVKEKIRDIFAFRIPYYVGPLNEHSPNAWVVRRAEKIYPWNFEKVVDVEQSAGQFIINLIGRCTYTGEPVLPKDSLLYSEFTVLNEINPLCVNGKPIDVSVKQRIFEDLFVDQFKTVTKKSIKTYLLSAGLIKPDDVISGVDDIIKSKLKSYHDFSRILEKTGDRAMVEDIIHNVLVFGEDKKLLKNYLKKKWKVLDDRDISYICRLKYRDFGRLSSAFLQDIYTVDENGEAFSIMDMLRKTNCNLMQLLTDKYEFLKKAEEHRKEHFGTNESLLQKVEDMYVAPSIKRSVYQTLRIVDEIVDIRKSAPKKVFIEVARGSIEDLKGKRTQSRKAKLLELYKACKADSGALFEALEATDENRLRHDALYLYYTQFGKCMYSGEAIDLERLESDYDVDHIFPQSRVKDDSLDNRVLVRRRLNQDKTNVYPIAYEIREKMRGFWYELKSKGLISDRKYERLVRAEGLTDDELAAFVSRQLVETQQSTKALATLFKELYPDTEIVYSKAGNVSDFRHQYDLLKCRDANDLHHAKDAYLDIVVGNVYHTKFTKAFFLNIRKENYSLNRVFDYDVKGAWDAGASLGKVRAVMSKNNITVTRMPHEAKGQLFDATIMPKGKGQFEIKKGREIEKYGGYNKVSGAYFFAVEHTLKGKRVRSIETVYIFAKELYERDPVGYCTEVLGLIEPRIVYKTIYFDALLEIDGKKLNITGRSNDSLLAKHPYQLSVDYWTETYIRDLVKYVERCKAAKKELPLFAADAITAAGNIALYKLFLDKLQTSAYSRYFGVVSKCCESGVSTFEALPVYDQCGLLLEMLKLFKCDRQMSDLTAIGGAANAGVIKTSKTISNAGSAYLYNQSVTGLYTYKVDLLAR